MHYQAPIWHMHVTDLDFDLEIGLIMLIVYPIDAVTSFIKWIRDQSAK